MVGCKSCKLRVPSSNRSRDILFVSNIVALISQDVKKRTIHWIQPAETFFLHIRCFLVIIRLFTNSATVGIKMPNKWLINNCVQLLSDNDCPTVDKPF